ncbi:MAG: hypothetical protein KDJ73_10420 [Notoacmeibacter sp.]|nr:hypothetical protein [Notoacmeibacter sp.]MCC0033035.1 hypothetical protein [Brucellaceae bacterium]
MKSRLARLLSVPFLLLAAAPPAKAGQSPWQDFEGARLRLVTEDTRQADGRLRGALQIDLKPGWKTYWREPGDAGIPPLVNLMTATGGQAVDISFPLPRRFKDAYSTWAGYDAPVSLALTLSPPPGGFPDVLRVSAFLGVCKEICIPVQAELETQTDDGSGAAETGHAFDTLPESATAEHGRIEAARIEGDALVLTGRIPAYHALVRWFVAGSGGWSFGDPETLPADGGTTKIALPVLARPKDGKGTIHYTFSGPPRGVSGTVEIRAD